MAEPPKKHIITGLDISKLSRVRPTKIPSVNYYTADVRRFKTSYRRIAIDVGIICLIILIAYSASVIGDFVFNDRYIVSYLAIKFSEPSFWSNLIVKAISQPLSQAGVNASFVSDLQNFGFEASWYHITNIVFHFFSCLYFYLLTYGLARYFWKDDGREQPVHEVALLAAVLFACHPLGCESVAHISGRVALLTACNIFLTLIFFVWAFLAAKIKNVIRGYSLTFVFFLLAIVSGLQALSLPFLMLLLAILMKPTDMSIPNWLREKWGEIFVIGFLIVIVLLMARPGFTADFSNGFVLPLQSPAIYIASQFRSLVIYYLRCLVMPVGLSIFPPFTAASGFRDPIAIIGLLIVVGGIFAAYKWRKHSLTAFGLLLAIFGYLPAVFFVQNEIAADTRFYLSIAGLSLVLASLLKPWLFSWRSSWKVRVAAVLIILVWVSTTIMHSLDFRTSLRLFKVAARVNPDDAWAKGMLANALLEAHKADQCINMAKQAIAMNQLCQPAHYALGKGLLPYKKHPDEARVAYLLAKKELEEALSLAQLQHLGALPLFESQRDLAFVLVELGEYKAAKELAEQALLFNPNSISLNLTMGKSLNGLGEYLRALAYLNKVYVRDQSNPDFIEPMTECALGIKTPSLINVAYNLSKMGVKVVTTHNMQVLYAHAALATGHLNESIQWIELACRERPNDAKALYIRSFVQRAAGKYAQARENKIRALLLDPGLPKKVPMVFLSRDKSTIVPFEQLYPLAKG